MIRFLLSRLSQALLALFALSVAVFLAVRLTGDPTTYLLSAQATDQDRANLRRALGLDQSLFNQFGIYISNVLHGDLGTSYTDQRPVLDVILERLPATMELAFYAVLFAALIGIPLGVWTAVKRRSLLDRAVQGLAIVGMSAPTFWVGIMLITLFAGYMGLLPTGGRNGPTTLILPVTVLVISLVGGMIRLSRTSMIEVLDSEYIKFARMRGLSPQRTIWKHALKNALTPVLTFSGIMLAALLNGTVVIESVFGWPGIGSLALQGVTERNYPLLQGTVLLSGLLYIGVSLAVDIAYAVIDPRVRHAVQGAAA